MKIGLGLVRVKVRVSRLGNIKMTRKGEQITNTADWTTVNEVRYVKVSVSVRTLNHADSVGRRG